MQSEILRAAQALAAEGRWFDIIPIIPNSSELLAIRGRALLGLRRDAEALDCFDRALAEAPKRPPIVLGRCLALARLGQGDTALAELDPWLIAQSSGPEVHGARSQILHALGRREEAWLAAASGSEGQAPDAVALMVRGVMLLEQGKSDEALGDFDAAISRMPTLAAAHQGRGSVLAGAGRLEESLAAFEEARRLDPNNPALALRMGVFFVQLNQFDRALQAFDVTLTMRPEDSQALQGRAQCLAAIGRASEAVAAYQRLLEIEPQAAYMRGELFHVRLHCCDWTDYETNRADLTALVRLSQRADNPGAFMVHTDSPEEQRLCARVFSADVCGALSPSPLPPPMAPGRRIRVGYCSADFAEHATTHLAAGLFEAHDRTKFETFAFSFGPDEESPMRRRVMRAFEHFEDVRHLTDHQIASRMRECGVDVAVDLKGHTLGARLGIFAYRPAPVQVSFLGYPGTLGVDFMDYVIADRTVIPEAQRRHFAEQVIYLPGSYQVNDSARVTGPPTTRRAAGLPDSAFIYCCFNSCYKITPAVFGMWMRILAAVPGSVLWLLDGGAIAKDNLQREAIRHGIDAGRLVFAPWVAASEHLARCALAEVFLDTSPCNAHTTASDALWMGVPVITLAGTSFTSRVATSLLRAVGLDSLSVFSPDAYIRLAIRLAEAPDELRSLRKSLEEARQHSDLFDSTRYCRRLEAAFEAIVARSRRGDAPAPLELREDSAPTPAQATSANDAGTWLAHGNAQQQRGALETAIASYVAALALDPNLPAALNNMGHCLRLLRRYPEAWAALERALELRPGYAMAHNNLGLLCMDLQRLTEGLRHFDRALEANPQSPEILSNRGAALLALRRFADAAADFAVVKELSPQFGTAMGNLLFARRNICDWSEFDSLSQHIVLAVDRGEFADAPLSFACVSDSSASQLSCARSYSVQRYPPQPADDAGTEGWRPEGASSERIRVAYLAGDFGEHALTYLLTGVIERHDRSRFEVVGIGWGRHGEGPARARAEAAFDTFIDATELSDAAIVRRLREMKVHIAVDLAGHTGTQRTDIFTRRAAPVQVNYLGFPATMGVPTMDYILADEFVIPAERRNNYSERIAYLPESFQANDDRRRIAAEPAARAHWGLPDTRFIWCSFHGAHKFTPRMFDIWARLVLAVPNSVLWLVGGNALVETNLRREAAARGLDPDRLLFAQHLAYPRHLARLQAADLCLDTFPFNGGATSSDALWAGVPLVTCAGDSFASRMSGSLLRTLGLPELVTHSVADYERVALELATHPERLAALRTRLRLARQTSPLFDTARFCRHVEVAYEIMVGRHAEGLPPATFTVPRLSAVLR